MNLAYQLISRPPVSGGIGLMTRFCSDGGTAHEEYLTIEDVAKRLRLSPKTVRNKMADGTFKRGIHYFSPHGLSPRFKWNAVKAWLESDQPKSDESTKGAEGIPMARGYMLQ